MALQPRLSLDTMTVYMHQSPKLTRSLYQHPAQTALKAVSMLTSLGGN